jgi:hypothetical protein
VVADLPVGDNLHDHLYYDYQVGIREPVGMLRAETHSWWSRFRHQFFQSGERWIDFGFVGLVIALRPQTPKHIRGGWSHYTDTSEPVDGNGAQNMVTVQSRFEPATFQSLAHELTHCFNRAHLKRERESGNVCKHMARTDTLIASM